MEILLVAAALWAHGLKRTHNNLNYTLHIQFRKRRKTLVKNVMKTNISPS